MVFVDVATLWFDVRTTIELRVRITSIYTRGAHNCEPTYRVTVGEHSAVLNVQVDIGISDLDTVHELANIDVRDTSPLVGVGVIPNVE